MFRRPRRPVLDNVAWRAPGTGDIANGPPLQGLWQPGTNEAVAVVILHGLGGHPASGCCVEAALAAAQLGWPSLRLAARTHPEHGPDYRYDHLEQDIVTALESPRLSGVGTVVLWGFSVGGAAAVRLATAPPHPAIRAAVAVCPPMDDAACEDALSRTANRVYKKAILSRLTTVHTVDAKRFGRAPPPPAASSATGVRAWEHIVTSSARPAMARPAADVQIPTLVVASPVDPLVPFASLQQALPNGVELRTAEGGHVYFRPGITLGQSGARGLMPQVAAWLEAAVAVTPPGQGSGAK